MRVCRTPLANAIGKGLNLLTLGSWEKAIAKYGYDKMFHLFLLIDIIDYRTGKVITVKYEKNETPTVNEFKDPLSNQTECTPVEKQYDGNLYNFITRSQKAMGTKFWDYDAFNNNCQDFLLGSLGANELLTANLQTFIKQNVDQVVRELPQYTTGLAKAVTDTARRVRTLFGRGLGGSLPGGQPPSTLSFDSVTDTISDALAQHAADQAAQHAADQAAIQAMAQQFASEHAAQQAINQLASLYAEESRPKGGGPRYKKKKDKK
jgi:hypothetical protein